MMRITILLLAVAFGSTFATSATKTNDGCGKHAWYHFTLESPNLRRHEEIVPGAAYIKHVIQEAGHCDNADFGEVDNNPIVFVKSGCSGDFKVNFIEGECDTHTLSSLRPNITLEKACLIHTMHCKRQHSDSTADCVFDVTFTFYNNLAKVANGCSCDFVICHDVKDNIPGQEVTTTTTAGPPATAMGQQPSNLVAFNEQQENKNTNGASDTPSNPNNHHNGTPV